MMDINENKLDAETRDGFIVEIKEDIEKLEYDLLTMEKENIDTDINVINHAFRAIHSIKGGAGFCGLDDLVSLSHSMENVLMQVRDQKLTINSDIIDALLAGLDKIKLMADDTNAEKYIPCEDEKKALEKIILLNSYSPPADDISGSVYPESSCDGTDTEISHGLFLSDNKNIKIKQGEFKKAIDEGKFVYEIHIDGTKDLIEQGKTPSDMIKDIEDSSDILFTELKKDTTEAELKNKSDGFHIILSSILDTDFLAEVLGISAADITLLDYDQLNVNKADTTSSSISVTNNSKVNSSAKNITVNNQDYKKLCQKDINDIPDKDHEVYLVSQDQFPADYEKPRYKGAPLVFPISNGKQKENTIPGKNSAYGHHNSGEAVKYDETIRVNTILAAKLMDLAGELVLSKNQLRPMMEQYSRENRAAEDVMQNLDRVTSELQEKIMLMRMQPVGKLLVRFKRIVRDTAKELSKKIYYTIKGKDVELDRTILEGLASPLTHILRNCIDHGIEPPEQRIKAGKSETGIIEIKVLHQGGHVYISIQDDGQGIDPEKIASKAVEKGIITKETAGTMTHREKTDLIFKPGFSTSDKITDISGRGVGMDVVKTNINRLRGRINIQSIPEQGTIVEIIIPLTLAIIPVLIAGTGKYRFAIPQLNVSEIVFSGPGDMQHCVEKFGNSEVMRFRKKLLPIVRLRNILNIDSFYTKPDGAHPGVERRMAIADRRNKKNNLKKTNHRSMKKDRRKNKWDSNYIIVLKMGQNKFGLCVESLFDNEEIVAKPLSEYIMDCKLFSGSTILGDGQIIMILNVSGLAEHAGLDFQDMEDINDETGLRLARNSGLKGNVSDNENKIILFSNDRNEYFALTINSVSRIETLNSCDIIKTGDHKFMKYRGESLALWYLDELLSVTPFNLKATEAKELYVIIPRGLSFSAGIIVTCIMGTMDVTGNLQKNDNIHNCVKGTMLIENKMVQFIDPHRICELIKNN